jgi:hypothetical protein
MNLIVCGDSWSNGAELSSTEQNFGQLLARKLNAILFNKSVDASSIPHLILQLRSAINEADLTKSTKALFFLTSRSRDVIWSDSLPKGTGFMLTHPLPHKEPEEIFLNPSDPLHKHWYTKYHSEKLSMFRCNTSLITLQAMCRAYNIQDYYVWGWEKFNLWPEVDKNKFFDNANTTIFNFFTDDLTTLPSLEFNVSCKYIWPNGSHPNQLGHELIADKLYPWINDVH